MAVQVKGRISKYLASYAENEASLADTLAGPWENVVVIPAYQESISLPRSIASLATAAKFIQKHVLVILVINRPQGGDHTDNRKIFSRWGAGMHHFHPFVDLYVLDRSSPGKEIPSKRGVGLARKIGCDLALALIQQQKVVQHWIYSTDADCHVPTDYFSRLDPSVVGYWNRFHHIPGEDTQLNQAHQLYESFLRYYLEGLRFANSPYAYPALGSILVFGADAYATVRGFPKRPAGEDFYLLNKLAKIGNLRERKGDPIFIQSRHSLRTPFGTGMATQKIVSHINHGKNYEVYHPLAFRHLRGLLLSFSDYFKQPDWDHWSAQQPNAYGPFFKSFRFKLAFQKASQSRKTYAEQMSHIHQWFDAIKTLKFLHFVRDNIHPNIRLSAALKGYLSSNSLQ